jgi:hypothetical protein
MSPFPSTIDALFEAFRKNDEIPPVEKFVERLQAKVNRDAAKVSEVVDPRRPG